MAGNSQRGGIVDPGPPAWPVFALLLPVLILAALASVAMIRDWRAARGEANARGKELVLEAAARTLPILAVPSSESPIESGRTEAGFHSLSVGFEIGESNQLLHPPPEEWPPIPRPLPPPPDAASRESWERARRAWNESRWSDAIRHFDEVLSAASKDGNDSEGGTPSDPGSRRVRLAAYERALALERAGATGELIAAFERVLGAFPWTDSGTRTEAGLPIGTLAALRIVELAGDDVGKLPVSWRTHAHQLSEAFANWPPSPFLSTLVERLAGLASTPDGRELWDEPRRLSEPLRRADFLRQCHAEAMRRLGSEARWPAGFWLADRTPAWLAWDSGSAVSTNSPPGPGVARRAYSLVPETRIVEALRKVRETLDRRGEFSLRLQLAGREIRLGDAGNAPWPRTEELASIRRTVTQDLDFELGVRLADPTAYYAGQRRRIAWFGGFLALSAGAALVSIAATRRALFRQQQLNREKSNFVSSVSHELRAPLASIRLLAEGLERGSVPTEERRKEYFRLIGQETRRLGALVENVLDYARIEQGRKRYEMEPTDLAALVRDTVRLAERGAADRSVRIALSGIPSTTEPGESADNAWELPLDGRSIQQALLNLIDNALKHAPDGSTVEVALAHRQPKGPKAADSVCVLSVHDQGPGIPKTDHERIFEPFFRRGSELRRETEGVGIGLSLVRHVAEAHGGRVEVVSEPGHGALFTLVLPAEERQSDPPGTLGSGPAKPPAASP
ncbi:MAG: sensor histidine kinase [Limisphaerales bacterium]